MKCLLFILLILSACTPDSQPRRGETVPSMEMGNSGGNGSDLQKPDEGAAWFLGPDRIIHACSEISPSFGVSETAAREAADRAMRSWRTYLEAKQVMFANSTAIATPIQIASLMAWVPCDGAEDLRFYFGVSDARVAAAKQGFTEPLGFAKRVSYDLHTGVGKGIIWIAGAGGLDALLTHELGHVFGCDHVAGTVMDKNFASEIRAALALRADDREVRLWALARIDQDKELLICHGCEQIYAGQFISYPAFERLAGRPSEGEMSAELEIRRGGEFSFRFILRDGRGEEPLTLELLEASARKVGTDAAIFKVVSDRRFLAGQTDGIKTYQATGGDGWHYLATIVAKSGKRYSVSLQFNAEVEASYSLLRKGQGVPLQIQGSPELNGGRTLFWGRVRNALPSPR